jgi:SAM-dependent methyltransferase
MSGQVRLRARLCAVSAPDRSRLSYKLSFALRNPGRVLPYARRRSRGALIGMKASDHVSYYRAVMKVETARNREAAVGSKTHDSWLKVGRLQFDYLLRHGLQPGDRMLEIGCGDLRAGRLFIAYLNPGNYYGIDISPDILLAAQETIARDDLQGKLSHLELVDDLKFRFLPAAQFTVVHAHSVFSHSPIEVIDECLANVGRVMSPDGVFDFTFCRTEGPEHQVLREDFYYRTETLLKLADAHGLDAELLEDWEELPHPQSKIRVTRRPGQRY